MPTTEPLAAARPPGPALPLPPAARVAVRLPLLRAELLVAAFAVLGMLVLRWFYAKNYAWNTDEPQHLHIVWAWVHGKLPYRDVFDNHTPFFHVLFAPIFAALGERADIVQWMRLAMLPLFAVSLWCVARLGRLGASPWAAVATAFVLACWPKFFLKMGEFRTDVLWTVLWLAALVVLTSGAAFRKRLFWGGMIFGAAMAVSLKTVFLLVLVLAAGGATWAIRRAVLRMRGGWDFAGAALAVLGLVIVPVAFALFFATQGAWKEMVYCVLTHNTLPEQNSVGGLAHRALSPYVLGVLPTAALCWLLLGRLRAEPERGSRQIFLVLVAGLFAPLLHALWPTITPQDYMPWFPVLFAALLPPMLDWTQRALPAVPRVVWPILLAAPELAWLCKGHPPLRNETAASVAEIATVLKLTRPGETVMDAKGDCIYRDRPYYFALESFTRRLLMEKKLPDDLVQCLIDKQTAVVLESPRMTPRAQAFIRANYRLIGGNVAVAGRELPAAGADGAIVFDLAIPQEYAMVSASGRVRGTLDGEPLAGARRLSAGRHEFRPEQPGQPVTLLWSRALEQGFTPFPSPAPHSPR